MIGENVKIHLPGESPWARITKELNGTVQVMIVNKLFHQHSEHEQAQFMKREFGDVQPLEKLHDYKQGDELLIKKNDLDEWVPA